MWQVDDSDGSQMRQRFKSNNDLTKVIFMLMMVLGRLVMMVSGKLRMMVLGRLVMVVMVGRLVMRMIVVLVMLVMVGCLVMMMVLGRCEKQEGLLCGRHKGSLL